jgi:hypothetical protein
MCTGCNNNINEAPSSIQLAEQVELYDENNNVFLPTISNCVVSIRTRTFLHRTKKYDTITTYSFVIKNYAKMSDFIKNNVVKVVIEGQEYTSFKLEKIDDKVYNIEVTR